MLLVERSILEFLLTGKKHFNEIILKFRMKNLLLNQILDELLQRDLIEQKDDTFWIKKAAGNHEFWTQYAMQNLTSFELEEIFRTAISAKTRNKNNNLIFKKVYLSKHELFYLKQLNQKMEELLKGKETLSQHCDNMEQRVVFFGDILEGELVDEVLSMHY